MEHYFFGGSEPHHNGKGKHNLDIGGILFVIAWTVFMCMLLLFCGCSTSKEYRNSVNVQHDTIRITQKEYQVDSVWRDRVQLIEVKGDSVFIRDSIFVEKWRYRTETDTLWKLQFIYQSDTVNIDTQGPVVKYERSGYDKFVSWGFWILVVLILSFIIWKVIRTFVLKI